MKKNQQKDEKTTTDGQKSGHKEYKMDSSKPMVMYPRYIQYGKKRIKLNPPDVID